MKLNIPKQIFDLSKEDIRTSEMLYDGKHIKCLVAPYHSFSELSKALDNNQDTYLFPENDELTTYHQIKNYISLIVKKHPTNTPIIVTASQTIICDMADDCVRILTQKGEIVKSPTKTFLANIHDIRYKVLENKDFELTEQEEIFSKNLATDIIDEVKSAMENGCTEETYTNLKSRIENIGEILISTKLNEMLSSVNIIQN